ncbi:MAG: DUF29 family protein [Cyanobacteria bacterium J06638_6]
MTEGWEEARLLAIAETGLPDEQFPESCPYTFEQMMGSDLLALEC